MNRHGILHALQRGRREKAWIGCDLDAEVLQLARRQEWRRRPRANAEPHIDLERPDHIAGDGCDVVAGHQRVREQEIGAGLVVEIEAADRLVEALDRGRVGARNDQEIRIEARGDGGSDLLDALFGRDHRLASEMAATLGPDLILDHDAGDAGALETADGEVSVDRIAVAGIGVGGKRYGAAGRQRFRASQVLLEAHDADIGPAEPRFAQPGARDRSGLEAERFDEPRAESVVDSGRHQDFRCVDEGANPSCNARQGRSPDARGAEPMKRPYELDCGASIPSTAASP
jgi:hypothetical protein